MAGCDIIQSAEQLLKTNWEGDIQCKLCGRDESLNHILFQCVIAQFVWSVLRDSLNSNANPTTLEEFYVEIMGSAGRKKNKAKIVLLAVVCWSLWLNRNEVFRNKILFSPMTMIYKFLYFPHHWQNLSKGEAKQELAQLSSTIMAKLGRWQDDHGETRTGIG